MPSESSAIKVVVKCRPFNVEEQTQGCKKIVKASGDKVIIDATGKEQSLSFDHCYSPNSSPTKVYSEACEASVQKALHGYNLSLLGYGATGSGKSQLLSGSEEEPGIVSSVIKTLYSYINSISSKKRCLISVTFVEVLNKTLTDLLNPHSNEMKIREHPHLGIYVDGLSELVVNSEDELACFYDQGNRARKMGATDVSTHRKMASSVFMIRIEQQDLGSSNVAVRSTITVADLAGQEADGGMVSKVLSALKTGGNVPYRDSKLTRLLQDSLGGNSITVILATVSIADKSYQETMKTLQSAQTARSIKNKIRVNLDEMESLISDLREEISRLRNKLTKSSDSNKEDVLKMEDLLKDLDVAKQQTWEEKTRRSQQYERDRKTNLANKGILDFVMDSVRKGNREIQDKIILMQKEKDQMTLEYKDRRKRVDDMKEELQRRIKEYSKLAESGKASQSDTKSKVTAIHDLKERVKKESEGLKDIKRKLKDMQDKQREEKEAAQGVTMARGTAQVLQMVEAEERRRLEAENKGLIGEEVERMKMEVQHEKAEIQVQASQGREYSQSEAVKHHMELVELRAERAVITLQLQTLQQEKAQVTSDLEKVHKRQKEELEIQQLNHFQTFRQYREMFEEQKAVLEARYRGMLEDAIQDAVFLSARNNELLRENHTHRQEIAELKDNISTGGRRLSKT